MIDIIIGFLCLLFIVIGYIISRQHHVVRNLHLIEFRFSDDPRSRAMIRGRPGGLIGTVLRMVNLAPVYQIKVTNRYVEIDVQAPFSSLTSILPMSQITTSIYGFQRPRWSLFAGIGLVFGGFYVLFRLLSIPVIGFLLLVFGGLILYFFYWNNQQIEVRYSAGDNNFWGFSFQIDEKYTINDAKRLVILINQLIYDSTQSAIPERRRVRLRDDRRNSRSRDDDRSYRERRRSKR